MNSRKNSFKRVAASALAVLTVAAYAAPVANVGGLPSGLVADAALEDTNVTADELYMVPFGGVNNTAYEYITNATDGTRTADATTIANAHQYQFTQGKVLTIASKVPLEFSNDAFHELFTNLDKDNKPLAFTTDLTVKNAGTGNDKDKTFYTYGDKYLVKEETDGSYTYKVLVSNNLVIRGKTTSANVVNTTSSNTLQLTDTNYVDLHAVTDASITVNGDKITAATTELTHDPVIKSKAKIVATKMFEVYVKDNTNAQAEIVNVAAKYDVESGKFIAEAPIPVTTGNVAAGQKNVTIYLNKVAPDYTYVNKGTYLLATAKNAPQVTAASITATYEAKVKKIKNSTDPADQNIATQAYKYDKVTEISSGSTVPNESRVVLTFNNDTTGEITSQQDDTLQNKFYTLKITKDGKELLDTDTPFVDDDCVYGDADFKLNTTVANVKSTNAAHVPGKDSEVSATATKPAASTSKLAFAATGTYKVEYTVYTKTKDSSGKIIYSPETLIFNFTIAPKSLLTAKNVRLTAANAKLNSDNGIIKKVGIVNGVVQFEVGENYNPSTDVVEVTPELFEYADDAADFVGKPTSNFVAGATDDATTIGVDESKNGTPKAITGTHEASALNTVYEMTAIYNNPEYSSGDEGVTIKWKLVEAKKALKITTNDDAKQKYIFKSDADLKYNGTDISKVAYFDTTVDKIATIREDLLDTMTIENADPDEIQFEYVKGFGITPTTQILNYHIDGLPKEVGKYSVFFVYEGEIVASCNVNISEHGLYAALTDEQTAYTYGEKKLTSDSIKFVDVKGKEVKNAGVKNAEITYYYAQRLTAAQTKNITADNKILFADDTKDADKNPISAGKYEVYTIGSDKYIRNGTALGEDKLYTNNYKNYVNAGIYIVKIAAAPENAATQTTVEKEGYAVQDVFVPVTVAKKAITSDMVVFNAKDYANGSTVYPTAGDYTVTDKTVVNDNNNGSYSVLTDISGNVTTAKDIGEYTIGVQVNALEKNYTGKVNAQWHVVKPAKIDKMNDLKFTEASTTIYDNGQIHFEVTRPDDTQFANGVAYFGVVIDKEGKIPAPTKEADANNVLKYPRTSTYTAGNKQYTNPAFEAAHKALQVGNGFKEGNQGPDQKAKTPKTYGANIEILDVDTGAWFRPYVIDGKGDIYYGEVIYVNLVQEATEQLKLTLAGADTLKQTAAEAGNVNKVVSKDAAKADQSATVLANKTWRNGVQSGYDTKENMYYVYGSYTLEGNNLVKESAVQKFGVVVDKKGAFASPDSYTGTAAEKLAKAKATVAEGLVLGNGFIEGQGGSKLMDIDEYGALIKPADSVTGVWVRAYVNLGKAKKSNKELVVYTDPIYINSVSDYYAGNTALANCAIARDGDQIRKITLTPGAITNATLKSEGVIVDTTGKYLKKNADGDYLTGNAAEFADGAAAKANTELLLGKNLLQGNGKGATYIATVNVETFISKAGNRTDIPVVVRPYAVYTINDKDVTIYGDAIVDTTVKPVVAP